MNPILILTKDVWFLAAFLVFLIGLGILFWGVAQLGNNPDGFRPQPSSRAHAQPRMERPSDPAYMHPAFSSPRMVEPPPPSPAASFANEASVMYGVLEERFTDLTKRIAALENGRHVSADPSLFLQPLMKRLDDLENEIEKLHGSVAQNTGAARGGDLTVLNDKISTLQRMMESLTMEPDAPKPT